ncbi:peptidoglycan recognition protein family protein [Actinokineospora sp.]|uniref:peptidoglycan recognition protein family protein n=1 Tax=Actinokineospora sp. TaxID=1872133 RepID=UPI004037B632
MTVNRRTVIRTGLAVSVVGTAGVLTTVPLAPESDAAEAAAAPTMYRKTTWGARPANGTITVLNRKPAYIVVHHTDGPNSSDRSKAHAFAVARSIQNYHMDSNGWADSGQQLTNSRGGYVMEGRRGSVPAIHGGRTHVVGANVLGRNSEVIGIENEGTYTSAQVPAALWSSLVKLVTYIAKQYDLAPSRIKGHRDFNSTACPGNVLYRRLPELRRAVGQSLGRAVVEEATWPLLGPASTGAQVLAAQHLLRAHGAKVPTDGVFGPGTVAAVRQFAVRTNVGYEPCYASRAADERGLLGAGEWPHLVRTVRVGDSGDFARAAQVLLDARGQRQAQSTVVDTRTWQDLLG